MIFPPILFPVPPFSVMFDFGLEVRNIAVGKDDIRCLKEAVEGHVKLHGVLWEPDLVVVDHAES